MRKTLLTSVCIALMSLSVQAQTKISFEASEGYNLGDINGQQGWTYWGETIDPNTGMVTTASSTDGSRSLHFISNEYEEVAGVEKTVTAFDKTQYSFDFKFDGLMGSDYTMAVWDTDYEPVAAFRVNYMDGNVSILNAETLEDTTLNLTPNTWYNFKMVVDMTARTTQYFVNNVSYGIKAVSAPVTGFNVIDFYYDDYGTGFTVDNIKIEDAANLSTKAVATADNFYVYPNPTADFVQIKTDGKINSVEVFDLSGKLVLKDASGNSQINLSGLKAGGYLLQANTSKGILTKKIMKK